jgi:hypothetical protein
VILNQVAWYFSSGTTYNIRGNLLHVSSSGPVTVIGWCWWPNTSGSINYTSAQMIPNPNGTGPTQTNFSGASNSSANSMSLLGFGSSWPGSGSPGQLTADTINGFSYMPQNYWIGPDDSIAFIHTNANNRHSTVGYHFTTITET